MSARFIVRRMGDAGCRFELVQRDTLALHGQRDEPDAHAAATARDRCVRVADQLLGLHCTGVVRLV